MKLRKSSSSRSSSSKKQQQQKNDQLQQRGSNSSRKKRQAAANVVQANPHLDAIPEEIMVMLASRFLSPADVAAAASCCVGWSRVLRKGEGVWQLLQRFRRTLLTLRCIWSS